jgi:hypothetical protein
VDANLLAPVPTAVRIVAGLAGLAQAIFLLGVVNQMVEAEELGEVGTASLQMNS